VVLLHGWPQTWYCWRKLIAPLAGGHTVVAPDLRGYGLSDKPPAGYDKRTMATDVRALARHLGHERVALLAGHDRGARVAHRWALDHPGEVERLAVLDVVPTREMFRRADASVARGYWHWLFHLQPDLPELLVGGNVEGYLGWFFERWTANRPAVEEAVPEYVRAFSAPGALRAGFDDYRATFPDDLDADEASAAAGQRLPMPLLVLWGAAGLPSRLPVLDIWRAYADDVRGQAIADCGHFLPEERPEEVTEHLLRFLEE
jgi:haloacetate dehalogenase